MKKAGGPRKTKAGKSTRAAPSAASSTFSRLGLLALSLGICLALSESALRVFLKEELSPSEDGTNLGYKYDPGLGWFPVPNSSKRFTASRTVTLTHNSDGFRSPEPVQSNKPVIVFLGDSLVWGFDVEANERFTEQLQSRHPEWDVRNLGISGYGTDQEYLLLQRYFEQYHPRTVFLVICGDNDNEDNSWNFRGGYYKPFYTLEDGHLKVNGVPVPRSEKVIFSEHPSICRSYLVRLIVRAYCARTLPQPSKTSDPPTGAILLDMRSFVAGKGASFAVGLQWSHPELEQFLQKYEIPYVDLSATNAGQRYPGFGGHWTPEGHAFVADKIDGFLRHLAR
jgi:hypothetical protein